MKTLAALLLASTLPLIAAEDAPKSSARDALKARIAADAKMTAPAKSSSPADSEGKAAAPKSPASAPSGTPAAAPATPAQQNAVAAKQPATVLPKVEVKKGRITELDQQLAKQEQDIAREAKNTKSTELDNALNDSKLARPLSIFGGDSTQFRKGVASERVQLMEAEKDLMEAIAHAKTKEEKATLQKQLDELKSLRRQLDKSAR